MNKGIIHVMFQVTSSQFHLISQYPIHFFIHFFIFPISGNEEVSDICSQTHPNKHQTKVSEHTNNQHIIVLLLKVL